MSEFDIDEVMPHKEPVTKPTAGPSRLSNADRRMGATAKEVRLKAGTALVALGSKSHEIKSGYAYKTGEVLGNTTLTPSIRHFEDLHSHAVELEHHIKQHEHAINSTDMDPATRERAQNSINMAYNTLADFHTENSKAMQGHIEGLTTETTLGSVKGITTPHTIANAANHITAAVDHLKTSYAAAGKVAHPIVSNVAAKAADTVQAYYDETGDAISEKTASILRRADNVASSKTMGGAQRLPMLTDEGRAQQRADIASRRSVEPKTVTGEEQQMMGRRDPRPIPGPTPEGQVRTPSGGFAPEADVAAAHARQHAAQQEMVAKEQEKVAALQSVVRFTPRIKSTTEVATRRQIEVDTAGAAEVTTPTFVGGDAPKGQAAPVNRFAAQRLERINAPSQQDPSRRARFEAQQAQAKEATEQNVDSFFKSKEQKQRIANRATQRNAADVQGHIDRGDLVSAAAAHFTFANPNVVVSPTVKLAKKHQKTIDEIKTNPVAYLSRQGFDTVGGSRPQAVREGRVRRERSIPAPPETRRPTTATTSAFTPQAESEYLEKVATADAEKAAKRNSAFQQGQAK
jgi:hypothetical protein